MRHTMKCWPEFFQPMLEGLKRFDLRRDDRPEGFHVGDEILQREWNPVVADTHFSHTSDRETAEKMGYTGRELLVRVDYIMDNDTITALTIPPEMHKYLDGPMFVIMSISKI